MKISLPRQPSNDPVPSQLHLQPSVLPSEPSEAPAKPTAGSKQQIQIAHLSQEPPKPPDPQRCTPQNKPQTAKPVNPHAPTLTPVMEVGDPSTESQPSQCGQNQDAPPRTEVSDATRRGVGNRDRSRSPKPADRRLRDVLKSARVARPERGTPSTRAISVSVGDLVRDAYFERESKPRPISLPFQ